MTSDTRVKLPSIAELTSAPVPRAGSESQASDSYPLSRPPIKPHSTGSDPILSSSSSSINVDYSRHPSPQSQPIIAPLGYPMPSHGVYSQSALISPPIHVQSYPPPPYFYHPGPAMDGNRLDYQYMSQPQMALQQQPQLPHRQQMPQHIQHLPQHLPQHLQHHLHQHILQQQLSGSQLSPAQAPQGQFAPEVITKPMNECHRCGTTQTPEWRRGPNGLRTLCNACGLYHAKLVKRKGAAVAAEELLNSQVSRGRNGRRISVKKDGKKRRSNTESHVTMIPPLAPEDAADKNAPKYSPTTSGDATPKSEPSNNETRESTDAETAGSPAAMKPHSLY